MIPAIVVQVAVTQRLRLGSLRPTRDFTYVTDTVEGFVRAAENDQSIGCVVNLGTGTEVSIGDLAHKIMAKLGRTVAVETEQERVRPAASEVERLCSDNSRARALLDWQPRVSLDEGLGRTIEWLAARIDAGHYGRYVV